MDAILYNIFHFGISLLFLIFGIKLLIQKGLLATKFLGLNLIILTGLIILSFFSTPEWMMKFPHLYKIATPFVYLLYPLAFLFQEFMLFPNKKFKPIYFIHFLPFILNFIELLPIYLSSSELKLEFFKEMIQQNSSIVYPIKSFYVLSGSTHSKIRLVQFFIYLIWMLVRLIRFFEVNGIKIEYKNRLLIYWLAGDIGLKFITISINFYFFIFPYKNELIFNWPDLFKIIDYIVLVLFLIYNPKLLDGILLKSLVLQSFHKKNELENKSQQSGENQLIYEKINEYFATRKMFLNPDFNQNIIAADLKLSSKKISTVIKEFTDLSFKDYVNTWRIQYLEEILKDGSNSKNYTIEGLCSEVGFGSRANFYLAFKKLKNISPKEYFKIQMKK